MLRIVTLAVIACVGAAGCASARSPARHPAASLTITYFPHGTPAGIRRWHLTCGPAGGSHPHPTRACRELAAHRGELAPVRHPCPLLIRRGAPQSEVVGRDDGRRVDRLVRPGCDAAVWRDMHGLLTGR